MTPMNIPALLFADVFVTIFWSITGTIRLVSIIT